VVVRNKARLVTQGFCQKGGVDFEETLALITRIGPINMLFAYVTSKGFKLYQMHVKSAFSKGFKLYIEKEVYVRQPPSFENPKFPNHFYKLHNTLYGNIVSPQERH
jgi:hypothetical protein